MKAIVYERYGGPEVLQLQAVEKPAPKEGEVLVKVHAVAVNPYDWHYMRGRPLFMRLQSGLFTPKVKIPGNDVAGVVEAVGGKVTKFKPGDEVIGSPQLRGLAEYVTIGEDRVAPKPAGMTMEESASLVIAGVTAMEAVRKFALVKPGQKVLVNGGSGGVGHYAVQIAKAEGAGVTGVCSTRNLEMVRALGAEQVIDYTQQSLPTGQPYDVVIDTIGNLTPAQYKQLTKREGRIAVVGYQNMSRLLSHMLHAGFGRPKLKIVTIDSTARELNALNELVATGKVKTVLDRTYPLEQTAEAIDYLEQGHARGKVVVKVS